LNPSHIVYTYKIINHELYNYKDKSRFNKDKSINTTPSIKFKGLNLPNTMDYLEWGKVIFQKDNFALVSKINSKFKYHINIFDNYLSTSLKYPCLNTTIITMTMAVGALVKINPFLSLLILS
jgi:hypothetical protein